MKHHVLDVRNLLCPMPVIRLQNTMTKLTPGDTVEVHATDPGTLQDIPAWCRVHGHELLSAARADGEVRLTVRVKG